jgi:peptidoglycan/LPS O-acetylase OafA/YrhL
MPIKRIQGLDAIKSIVIIYIVFSHFITFWTNNPIIVRLCKQHNLIVGIFFVLSGFVLSFSKEQGAPFLPFMKSRLRRIYPLHAVILLTFIPLFCMIDLHYGSIKDVITNGVLSFGLLQSWVPSHSVIWNGPSWFLSSLLFCYLLFPFVQKKMYAMSARQIVQLIIGIQILTFFIFFLYSSIKGWGAMEDVATPPSLLFNVLRFNPLMNSFEFILGMAVCNLWRKYPIGEYKSAAITTITAMMMVALLLGRSFIEVNDLYLRSQVLIPLFCLFLYAFCWQKGIVFSFLSSKIWNFISTYSFTVYLIHVPVGMFFYKKVIAKQLFQATPHWSLYFMALLVFTFIFQHGIEQKIFTKVFQKRRNRI